jgi:hypothetical protein
MCCDKSSEWRTTNDRSDQQEIWYWDHLQINVSVYIYDSLSSICKRESTERVYHSAISHWQSSNERLKFSLHRTYFPMLNHCRFLPWSCQSGKHGSQLTSNSPQHTIAICDSGFDCIKFLQQSPVGRILEFNTEYWEKNPGLFHFRGRLRESVHTFFLWFVSVFLEASLIFLKPTYLLYQVFERQFDLKCFNIQKERSVSRRNTIQVLQNRHVRLITK